MKIMWSGIPILKNIPQFLVIHTIKGFIIVKESEIDFFFLEFSCFFYDSMYVSSLISVSSVFSKFNLDIRKFSIHILLKPSLENFENYFACV